jgi:hypothetical protein
MAVQDTLSEAVASGAKTYALSQFLTVTGTSDPTYLVVSALDRDEYTVTATGAVGDFSGDGHKLALAAAGGDARAAGIVFTWTNGQYVNATYGALSALEYVSSASAADMTNISVFTTANQALAAQDAANPVALAQADPSGYVGSVSVVTDAHPYAAPASGAGSNTASGGSVAAVTPDAVAACAESFVGRAWNENGCWVLASTIAAEAGAGLPVTTTAVGVAGHGSGEWAVVYNGPVQASSTWQSLVTTGDIVVIGTPGGGGHITTCVSGSGSTAMLVDNITYENAAGQITNSAHDGAASDVLVAAAHPASQEWAGVQGSSVVIYALDTPVVTARAALQTVAAGHMAALSTLATVSDPAAKAITAVQAYDSGTHVLLAAAGGTPGASSLAHPVSAASLAAISVQASGAAGTDTLEVRAFNGTYWGDWQSVVVQAGAGAAAANTAGFSMAGLLGAVTQGPEVSAPATGGWHGAPVPPVIWPVHGHGYGHGHGHGG